MASFIIDDKMMHGGLGLKGCELLLFGLILSYTKLGKTLYQKEETIASRFGYSREHICRSLKCLVEKGYIHRLRRHPKAETFEYVINQSILDTYIQGDEKSQPIVDLDHFQKKENITQRSDVIAHNIINNKTDIREGDTAAPSINFDNPILEEKWKILMKSEKWRRRSTESLAETQKKLKSYPPGLAILMISHTIEGDYPMVYAPTPEMVAKAEKESPANIAMLKADNDITNIEDNDLFRKIYPLIPEQYQAAAMGYSKRWGRALSFVRNSNHTRIIVYYPAIMEDWINQNHNQIEEQLTDDKLKREFQYIENR